MKNLKIQLLHNNSWHDIDLENLRKGNIIRILDENNNPIKDEYGNIERECICDAYLENKEWIIKSKPRKLNIYKESENEL